MDGIACANLGCPLKDFLKLLEDQRHRYRRPVCQVCRLAGEPAKWARNAEVNERVRTHHGYIFYGPMGHVDEVLQDVAVAGLIHTAMQVLDHVQAVHVHGDGGVIVEVLSPPLGPLEMHDKVVRVGVAQPASKVLAMTLVVLTTVVEFLRAISTRSSCDYTAVM